MNCVRLLLWWPWVYAILDVYNGLSVGVDVRLCNRRVTFYLGWITVVIGRRLDRLEARETEGGSR